MLHHNKTQVRVESAPTTRMGTRMDPNSAILSFPRRLVGWRTKGLKAGHFLSMGVGMVVVLLLGGVEFNAILVFFFLWI